MNQQLQFDICSNRHRNNPESVSANLRVEPVKRELQERILAYVKGRGAFGATTEEISKALGLRYTTASARVSELKKARELFVKSRRPTSTGSSAGVLTVSL